MFTLLIDRITKMLVTVFRTVKSSMTRSVLQVYNGIKTRFEVSQRTSNSISHAMMNITAYTEKPSERSDFFETKSLFISKNFLVKLLFAILLFGVFCYLVVYPLAMRYLFTAKLYVTDEKLDSYTGDVVVYYDKDKTVRCYEGHLEDGKLEGEGRWYDTDGVLEYEGNFEGHLRSGEGKLYEAGELIYEGGFAGDLYEGNGKEYSGGRLIRSGTYLGGVLENGCTYHKNGNVAYRGQFTDGKQTGEGTGYYESGRPQYTGEYVDGVRSGEGKLFDTEGNTIYEGGFQNDVYEGTGKLYLENGYCMTGEFFAGIQGGDVTITKNGVTYYEGGAVDTILSGEGTLCTKDGSAVYSGSMSRGTVNGESLLGLTLEEVQERLEGEEVFTVTVRETTATVVKQEDLGLYLALQNEGEGVWRVLDASLCRTEEMSPELSQILWSFAEDTDGWKKAMWSQKPLMSGLTNPQYTSIFLLDEAKPCVVYEDDDAYTAVWTEDGECFMLQWTLSKFEFSVNK